MAAIITNKFRIHNQEQFVESFSESSANVYYLGIGRPQAFATQTRGDSRTEAQGSDHAAAGGRGGVGGCSQSQRNSLSDRAHDAN